MPDDDDLQRSLENSGLLDHAWYASTYAEAIGDGAPLRHYCAAGWRRGFRPNPYFDPKWYAATYAVELQAGENPLVHYMRRGERENAWPSPHFDPEWYRDVQGLDATTSPLAHYLRHRNAGSVSPLPVFDATAYAASNPDWPMTAYDPYWHSLQRAEAAKGPPPASASPWGRILAILGSDPEDTRVPEVVSADAMKEALRLLIPLIPFDEAWYKRTYADVAAALEGRQIESAHGHFIEFGFFEGRSPRAPEI
jgi:hypothetical protein